MFTPSKILSAERVCVLLAFLIGIVLSWAQLTKNLDWLIYDQIQSFGTHSSETNVALIAIDEQSLAELGRWPWSRTTHATLLEKIRGSEPTAIVLNFLFSEPEQTSELVALQNLQKKLHDTQIYLPSSLNPDSSESAPGAIWDKENRFLKDLPEQSQVLYRNLQKDIAESLTAIDRSLLKQLNSSSADKNLTAALNRTKAVLLPVYFSPLSPSSPLRTGSPAQSTPNFVIHNAATFIADGRFSTQRDFLPENFGMITHPIAELGNAATSVGHINYVPEKDGVLRSHKLLINHNGKLYPSLALSTAALSLGLEKEDILFQPGIGAVLGKRKLPTNEQLEILPLLPQNSAGTANHFSIDSYSDVINGYVPTSKFKNKIVIIGITAKELSSPYRSSSSQYYSPSELLGYTINSITEQSFAYAPPWSKLLTWLALCFLCISLFFASPRMRIKHWLALLATLTAITLLCQLTAFKQARLWLPFSQLYVFYALSFLFVNLWKFSAFEKATEKTALESSENNKMLGLTYQNQGQLDLAFDKLKRCIPDNSIADALYGLGLDFERKRLFHKAKLVYQHIEQSHVDFRDVAQRILAIKGQVPDLSPFSNPKNDKTVKISNGSAVLERPRFGRYDIEKEIGRGGMGAVYLGKDPKIDRVVAIKTLDFSKEYSGEALVEAKSQFYKEAKAVGMLSHRNIVTVYDVGEEHDLAYIAMEFLPGKDLNHYTKKATLLSVRDVLTIGIACSDALNYAHSKSVVHRDIKPSNIIYEEAKKRIRITDFGIALIQNSEATRTASIIGSPSYMSPEQLRGEPLDGKSDTYSLGVTLYLLLTGEKPFNRKGENTSDYAILNNPTPKVVSVRDDIPEFLSKVIYKSMQKRKENRFSSAESMRDALKACLTKLS